MAISLKTAGTWARMVTDGGTVAIPGTPASGDRMFLFGTWKTYDITVANPSGWTPIGSVYADGTTAAGNGTGSVSVMAWYRDWVSGDSAPAIDYSAAPTEGLWVIQLWTKAGGDTWGTPSTTNAAISAASPFSATSVDAVTIPNASVVMALVGLRDDSTTFTRATTAIADDGSPTVTWNGDYVESPATHISSTTGQDMAADLGHRFVTTGASGVNLVVTGTPAAAETGAAKFVIQALFTADPKTATPSTAALTTSRFAPTVTASDHKTATPGTASLATARFAPTVTATANQRVTPGVATLSTSAFAPTVTASDHKSVVPTTASLTTATFAPTVTVAAQDVTVTPTTASLTVTTFAPTVTGGAGVTVTPSTASLALTSYAPVVTATNPVSVTPGVASLTLTSYAPGVAAGITVTTGAGSLTLATFAPAITTSANVRVTPPAASLTLTAYAPTITGAEPVAQVGSPRKPPFVIRPPAPADELEDAFTLFL